MLRPVKDDPGLKIPRVYGIPCECGKTHIGQTNRTIETRRKEHMRHLISISISILFNVPWIHSKATGRIDWGNQINQQ
jgi:hypothetical protein